MRHTVIHHHFVQIRHLSRYVGDLVGRMLQKHASHDDLEGIAILWSDHILLVRHLVDAGADSILQDFDVLHGEEGARQIGIFPLSKRRFS